MTYRQLLSAIWHIFKRIYLKKAVYMILGMWLLLAIQPFGFIPDFFRLNIPIASGSYSRICLSFVSVFSFLVTVLVLNYGFLREKFRRLTLSEFLDSLVVRLLCSFFISIFLVNILTALYVDARPTSDNSISLGYYSLILSLGYFVVFLPFALLAMSTSDSQFLIDKQILRIRSDVFSDHRTRSIEDSIDETNPLNILNNLIRISADKDDFHSVNKINFAVYNKITELIGDSKDRFHIARILKGQSMLWKTIIQKSVQKKEFEPIEGILLIFRNYHEYYASHNIPLLYLEVLREVIEDLLETIVNLNGSDLISDASVTIEQSLSTHYKKSVPAEDKIQDLKDRTDEPREFKGRSGWEIEHYDLQWEEIAHRIPGFLTTILRKAINEQKENPYRIAMITFNSLIMDAHRSTMTIKQKAEVIRFHVMHFYFYQEEAIKIGLIKEPIKVDDLNSALYKFIDNKSEYVKDTLVQTSEFLITLAKYNMLDKYSFNIVASVGRHCAREYLNNDVAKEGLEYILKVIEYFKKSFETNLGENKDNYQFLIDTVSSFIEFHKMPEWRIDGPSTARPIDLKLIEKLEDYRSQFQSIGNVVVTHRIDWD